MAKEIIQGHTARLRIKAGIDKACDAVRPTLGPIGMTAAIEYPGLDPIECDDGVTILKNIDLADPYENMGVQMLRKGGLRTSEQGGDGTATTTVLTQALVHEAFKEIASDSSKIREVRERLQQGLVDTLAELTKLKRDITQDDIERIATISSLDPEVARLIADVVKEVGVNGVITVEKGAQLGYTSEVVKGARFDKGLISPYFINDPENKQTVLNEPYIVLVDRTINTNEQILSLLNSIGTGNDILFIADDVASVALGTLAQNAVNRVANIACVRNPYTASAGKDFLFDMAALTGGTVISEEMGMRLDEATSALCGRAEKAIITQHNTTIIGGNASPLLESRIASIQGEIDSTTSPYMRGQLEDRLAQLTGGIGVIRVGAYTDTEYNAKKYKFDNAINATQAALQEGILPGGGTSLAVLKVSEPIFQRALSAPLRQMATNAGMFRKKHWWSKPSVEWLVNNVSKQNLKEVIGFDFKKKSLASMVDCGIIDPFKVTRIALESATAITSALISIETAIVETKKDGKDTQ
jgi:chaperonin GroEL